MRAGRLRHRLVLQSKDYTGSAAVYIYDADDAILTDADGTSLEAAETGSGASRDAYGAALLSWATQDTVWGAIEPLSGKEYFSQQAVQAEARVRIVIRYHSTISTSWRVSHDGLYYDILDVLNENTRDRQLILMCSEGVRDDTGSVTTNYLLLESGDQLLLESSGSLLLES